MKQTDSTLVQIVPAPVGTYVLHVRIEKGEPVILQHVCTHFERLPDQTILPRCMILADENIVEAACLHPSGHISGSHVIPITFENVGQYMHSLRERYRKAPTTRKSEAFKRARAMLEGEDLVG